MRKHLVILRAGAESLHRGWMDPDQERSWDLYVSPYQALPDEVQGDDCRIGEVVPGPKWSGLRTVLESWDGWRDYDRIWFPDDDVSATQPSIDELFRVAEALRLDLFAPALTEDSYYAHYDMMRNRSFFGRWVGFVEILVPGFSRSALERVLPTFGRSTSGWGLGLDSVWPKLLDHAGIAVLDGLAVTHTRPVGGRRDPDLARRMLEESSQILAEYGCSQVHTTFGAFDERLQPLELTPEQLLLQLVDGWRYLIDHDPRLLPWIVDAQRQRYDFAPYPDEGTPSEPPG